MLGQSRFLEASLVRQADGKLKNMIQYGNKSNCENKKYKNLYFGKSFMNLDQIFADL